MHQNAFHLMNLFLWMIGVLSLPIFLGLIAVLKERE